MATQSQSPSTRTTNEEQYDRLDCLRVRLADLNLKDLVPILVARRVLQSQEMGAVYSRVLQFRFCFKRGFSIIMKHHMTFLHLLLSTFYQLTGTKTALKVLTVFNSTRKVKLCQHFSTIFLAFNSTQKSNFFQIFWPLNNTYYWPLSSRSL